MPNPVYWRIQPGTLCFGNDALELRFDTRTGCWLGLTDRLSGREVIRNPQRLGNLSVVSGGREVVVSDIRNPLDPPLEGEATYTADTCLSTELVRQEDGCTLELTLQAGPWRVRELWQLSPHSDIARLRLELLWQGAAPERLRRVLFSTPLLTAGQEQDCTYEAPGLPIAPHLALSSLDSAFRMSLGDTPTGTPGLAALCDRTSGQVIMSWSYAPAEPTWGWVYREPQGIRIEHRLLLTCALAPGESASGGGFYYRACSGGWDAALERFQRWYAEAGLVIPRDRPAWTERASLYELHIGNAVVAEGPYAPLPTAHDLLERLPYIKALGFNTVQIMPRQPYSGYSVHDYMDVTTQYGDEEVLREVIRTAHALGLRVIADLVIHGCNDKVVALNTYERSGHEAPEWLLLWAQIAPDRSPYLDAHADWFLRDEQGQVRWTYTWAFEHLSDSYQRHLIEALSYYVTDLGLDGFRVDAPTWNYLPNWDPQSPYRAGDSYYGWARLFARARPALKQAKPEVMLYAEGNGPLYMRDFDIRYDYDGQWLFAALLPILEPRAADWHPSVGNHRIDARELGEWLHERRLAHPAGTVLAHHIDSHDSFWGHALFRRQVFGPDAWRPCFALCALTDGCIMHYIGGELGNEEFVRSVMRLRRELPEVAEGDCYLRGLPTSDAMVYAPLHSLGALHTIPVLNLSNQPTRVRITLPADRLGAPQAAYTLFDALGSRMLTREGARWSAADLGSIELDLPPYGVAVLVLRPA